MSEITGGQPQSCGANRGGVGHQRYILYQAQGMGMGMGCLDT